MPEYSLDNVVALVLRTVQRIGSSVARKVHLTISETSQPRIEVKSPYSAHLRGLNFESPYIFMMYELEIDEHM